MIQGNGAIGSGDTVGRSPPFSVPEGGEVYPEKAKVRSASSSLAHQEPLDSVRGKGPENSKPIQIHFNEQSNAVAWSYGVLLGGIGVSLADLDCDQDSAVSVPEVFGYVEAHLKEAPIQAVLKAMGVELSEAELELIQGGHQNFAKVLSEKRLSEAKALESSLEGLSASALGRQRQKIHQKLLESISYSENSIKPYRALGDFYQNQEQYALAVQAYGLGLSKSPTSKSLRKRFLASYELGLEICWERFQRHQLDDKVVEAQQELEKIVYQHQVFQSLLGDEKEPGVFSESDLTEDQLWRLGEVHLSLAKLLGEKGNHSLQGQFSQEAERYLQATVDRDRTHIRNLLVYDLLIESQDRQGKYSQARHSALVLCNLKKLRMDKPEGDFNYVNHVEQRDHLRVWDQVPQGNYIPSQAYTLDATTKLVSWSDASFNRYEEKLRERRTEYQAQIQAEQKRKTPDWELLSELSREVLKLNQALEEDYKSCGLTDSIANYQLASEVQLAEQEVRQWVQSGQLWKTDLNYSNYQAGEGVGHLSDYLQFRQTQQGPQAVFTAHYKSLKHEEQKAILKAILRTPQESQLSQALAKAKTHAKTLADKVGQGKQGEAVLNTVKALPLYYQAKLSEVRGQLEEAKRDYGEFLTLSQGLRGSERSIQQLRKIRKAAQQSFSALSTLGKGSKGEQKQAVLDRVKKLLGNLVRSTHQDEDGINFSKFSSSQGSYQKFKRIFFKHLEHDNRLFNQGGVFRSQWQDAFEEGSDGGKLLKIAYDLSQGRTSLEAVELSELQSHYTQLIEGLLQVSPDQVAQFLLNDPSQRSIAQDIFSRSGQYDRTLLWEFSDAFMEEAYRQDLVSRSEYLLYQQQIPSFGLLGAEISESKLSQALTFCQKALKHAPYRAKETERRWEQYLKYSDEIATLSSRSLYTHPSKISTATIKAMAEAREVSRKQENAASRLETSLRELYLVLSDNECWGSGLKTEARATLINQLEPLITQSSQVGGDEEKLKQVTQAVWEWIDDSDTEDTLQAGDHRVRQAYQNLRSEVEGNASLWNMKLKPYLHNPQTRLGGKAGEELKEVIQRLRQTRRQFVTKFASQGVEVQEFAFGLGGKGIDYRRDVEAGCQELTRFIELLEQAKSKKRVQVILNALDQSVAKGKLWATSEALDDDGLKVGINAVRTITEGYITGALTGGAAVAFRVGGMALRGSAVVGARLSQGARLYNLSMGFTKAANTLGQVGKGLKRLKESGHWINKVGKAGQVFAAGAVHTAVSRGIDHASGRLTGEAGGTGALLQEMGLVGMLTLLSSPIGAAGKLKFHGKSNFRKAAFRQIRQMKGAKGRVFRATWRKGVQVGKRTATFRQNLRHFGAEWLEEYAEELGQFYAEQRIDGKVGHQHKEENFKIAAATAAGKAKDAGMFRGIGGANPPSLALRRTRRQSTTADSEVKSPIHLPTLQAANDNDTPVPVSANRYGGFAAGMVAGLTAMFGDMTSAIANSQPGTDTFESRGVLPSLRYFFNETLPMWMSNHPLEVGGVVTAILTTVLFFVRRYFSVKQPPSDPIERSFEPEDVEVLKPPVGLGHTLKKIRDFFEQHQEEDFQISLREVKRVRKYFHFFSGTHGLVRATVMSLWLTLGGHLSAEQLESPLGQKLKELIAEVSIDGVSPKQIQKELDRVIQVRPIQLRDETTNPAALWKEVLADTEWKDKKPMEWAKELAEVSPKHSLELLKPHLEDEDPAIARDAQKLLMSLVPKLEAGLKLHAQALFEQLVRSGAWEFRHGMVNTLGELLKHLDADFRKELVPQLLKTIQEWGGGERELDHIAAAKGFVFLSPYLKSEVRKEVLSQAWGTLKRFLKSQSNQLRRAMACDALVRVIPYLPESLRKRARKKLSSLSKDEDKTVTRYAKAGLKVLRPSSEKHDDSGKDDSEARLSHIRAYESLKSKVRKRMARKGQRAQVGLKENLSILAKLLSSKGLVNETPELEIDKESFDPTLRTAYQLTNRVVQALTINRFVLLSGDPASGKTEVGRYLSKILNWPHQMFNAHRYVSEEELMQKVGVTAKKGGGFVMLEGPLAKALRDGELFIFNEIHRGKAGNLSFLFKILADIDEEFDYYDAKLGEVVRVKIHPNFRMIATRNLDGEAMNAALQNRAIEFHTKPYHPSELEALLQERFSLSSGLVESLVHFYTKHLVPMIGTHEEGYVWTLRHLMRLAQGFQNSPLSSAGEGQTEGGAQNILQIFYETIGVSLHPKDRENFFQAIRLQLYDGVAITKTDIEAFQSKQQNLNIWEVCEEFGIDRRQAIELAGEMGIQDIPTSARYLRSILFALTHGYHPSLKGPHGTGKTQLARYAARLLGKLYPDALTPQTDEGQLKGEFKPKVIQLADGSERLGFDYIPAPLVEALRDQDSGDFVTVLLDEAGFGRPDVMEELHTLLDRDGGIWVLNEEGEGYEFLERPKNFRLILAGNTYGYEGVSLQSYAFRSRTHEIYMNFEYTQEEIATLLQDDRTEHSLLSGLHENIAQIFEAARQIFVEHADGANALSLREVYRIKKYLATFLPQDGELEPEQLARVVVGAMWQSFVAHLPKSEQEGELGKQLRQLIEQLKIPGVESREIYAALSRELELKAVTFDPEKSVEENLWTVTARLDSAWDRFAYEESLEIQVVLANLLSEEEYKELVLKIWLADGIENHKKNSMLSFLGENTNLTSKQLDEIIDWISTSDFFDSFQKISMWTSLSKSPNLTSIQIDQLIEKVNSLEGSSLRGKNYALSVLCENSKVSSERLDQFLTLLFSSGGFDTQEGAYSMFLFSHLTKNSNFNSQHLDRIINWTFLQESFDPVSTTRMLTSLNRRVDLSMDQFNRLFEAIWGEWSLMVRRGDVWIRLSQHLNLNEAQLLQLTNSLLLSTNLDIYEQEHIFRFLVSFPGLTTDQLDKLIDWLLLRSSFDLSGKGYNLISLVQSATLTPLQFKHIINWIVSEEASTAPNKVGVLRSIGEYIELPVQELDELIHWVLTCNEFDASDKALVFGNLGENPNLTSEQLDRLAHWIMTEDKSDLYGKFSSLGHLVKNPSLTSGQLEGIINWVLGKGSLLEKQMGAIFIPLSQAPSITEIQLVKLIKHFLAAWDQENYVIEYFLQNPKCPEEFYEKLLALYIEREPAKTSEFLRRELPSKARPYLKKLHDRLQVIHARIEKVRVDSTDSAVRIIEAEGDETDLPRHFQMLADQLRAEQSGAGYQIEENPQLGDDENFDFTLVTAHQLLDRVVQALAINRFVLLSGDPASGKTEVGRYLSDQLGWKYHVFNAHRYVSEEELMQKVGVTTTEDGRFVIMEGPLADALRTGKLFIFNEIHRAKSGNLSFLFKILADIDETFDYYDPIAGTVIRVPIHPNFRMIATRNLDGTKVNAALKNRSIEIHARPYSDLELEALLTSKYSLSKKLAASLVSFYTEVKHIMGAKAIGEHAEGYVWTLRQLMRLAEGFTKAPSELSPSQILEIFYEAVGSSLTPQDRDALYDAIARHQYLGVSVSKEDIEQFQEHQQKLTLREVYQEFDLDPVRAEELANEMGIKDIPTSAKYLRSILSALTQGYHPWLKGPHGTGKSQLARYAAKLLGDVHMDTITPQTDEGQLKGEFKPKVIRLEDGTETLGFDHIPSALVKALRSAGNPDKKLVTVILDEASFGRPDVMEELHSLLDRDGGIWVLKEDGSRYEFLKRPDSFRLILASNTYGYEGVNLHSDAFRSRTHEIYMDFEFSVDDFATLLEDERHHSSLSSLYDSIAQAFEEARQIFLASSEDSAALSLREVHRIKEHLAVFLPKGQNVEPEQVARVVVRALWQTLAAHLSKEMQEGALGQQLREVIEKITIPGISSGTIHLALTQEFTLKPVEFDPSENFSNALLQAALKGGPWQDFNLFDWARLTSHTHPDKTLKFLQDSQKDQNKKGQIYLADGSIYLAAQSEGEIKRQAIELALTSLEAFETSDDIDEFVFAAEGLNRLLPLLEKDLKVQVAQRMLQICHTWMETQKSQLYLQAIQYVIGMIPELEGDLKEQTINKVFSYIAQLPQDPTFQTVVHNNGHLGKLIPMLEGEPQFLARLFSLMQQAGQSDDFNVRISTMRNLSLMIPLLDEELRKQAILELIPLVKQIFEMADLQNRHFAVKCLLEALPYVTGELKEQVEELAYPYAQQLLKNPTMWVHTPVVNIDLIRLLPELKEEFQTKAISQLLSTGQQGAASSYSAALYPAAKTLAQLISFLENPKKQEIVDQVLSICERLLQDPQPSSHSSVVDELVQLIPVLKDDLQNLEKLFQILQQATQDQDAIARHRAAVGLVKLSAYLKGDQKAQSLDKAWETTLKLAKSSEYGERNNAIPLITLFPDKIASLSTEVLPYLQRYETLQTASLDSAVRVSEMKDPTDLPKDLQVLANLLQKNTERYKTNYSIQSSPHLISDDHFDSTLVTAHELTHRVVQALAINRFVLLSGDPASGKTEVGRYLSRLLNWPHRLFNAHRYVSEEELMQRIGVTLQEDNRFVITEGPLAQALRRGELFIFNEIHRGKSGNLSFLFKILADIDDEFDYYDAESGQVIRQKIHPNFRMIATRNLDGPPLNAAFKNRAIEIHARPYSDLEFESLLHHQYGLPKDLAESLVSFYTKIRHGLEGRNLGGHAEGYAWTLRHLIRLAKDLAEARKADDPLSAQQVIQIFYEKIGASFLPQDRALFYDILMEQKYGDVVITSQDIKAFQAKQQTLSLWKVCEEFGINVNTAQDLAREMGMEDIPTSAKYLRSILSALKAGYHPWLKGPHGTGKSQLARYAAKLLGKVYLDTITPQTDEGQLKGEFKPRVITLDDGSERLGFDHIPAPLVRALRDAQKPSSKTPLPGGEGASEGLVTVILDEASFGRPDVMEELHTLLDRDGGVWVLNEAGERYEFLERPKNFRLILASNTYGYQGVHLQSDAFRSRTHEIYMDFEFSGEELDRLLGQELSPSSREPSLPPPSSVVPPPMVRNLLPQASLMETSGEVYVAKTPKLVDPQEHAQEILTTPPPQEFDWGELAYNLDSWTRSQIKREYPEMSDRDLEAIEVKFGELRNRMLAAAAAIGRTDRLEIVLEPKVKTCSMRLEEPRVFRVGPRYLLGQSVENLIYVAMHEGAHADIDRIGTRFFFTSERMRALGNTLLDIRANARVMDRAPGQKDGYYNFLHSYYSEPYETLPKDQIPDLLPHEAFLQSFMIREYGGESPWEKDPVVGPAIEKAWKIVQQVKELRPKDRAPKDREVSYYVTQIEELVKRELNPIYQELHGKSLEQVEAQLVKKNPSASPEEISEQARQIIETRAKHIADHHAPQEDLGAQQEKAREIFGEDDIELPDRPPETRPGSLEESLQNRHWTYQRQQAELRRKTYSKLLSDLKDLPKRVFVVLDRLLKPNTDFEYEGYFSSGPRVNLERAFRAIRGWLMSLKVFEKKTDPTASDYRFRLLLDASGSMADRGVRERGGLGLAALFMDVFERLKISYGLDAFHHDYIPLKDFSDRIPTVAERDAFFNNLRLNQWGMGGTYIELAIEEALKKIREARKSQPRDHEFLFVLTDGEANYGKMQNIRQLCKEAAREGVIVVGIGIGKGMDTVREGFPIHLIEENPENLPHLLGDFLQKYVQTRRGP